MSMPPGEAPEPPTSPMTPYPAASPGYSPPSPPSVPSPREYPEYPAAENPYNPPAPPSAPTPPSYTPPAQYSPPPPPPYLTTNPAQAQQYPGGLASVEGDPLVLPPNASFSAWFTMVANVAKRSWKSALIIATLGIGVPRGFANLVAGLAGWGGSWEMWDIGHFFRHLFDGFAIVGLFFTLIAVVAACYVATAGWAAGVWALVQEAATGRPANLGQAFSYGLRRATKLFPWTVMAGAAFTVGYAFLYLPGLYLAFAVSLFGLVGLFERSPNPLQRSFQLTHRSASLGPTAGKVGLAFVAYAILAGIAHGIFAIVAGAFGIAGAISGAGVLDIVATIIVAIGEIFTGPAFAVLLLTLLPTYAELRAQENGGATTTQLQQQLG